MDWKEAADEIVAQLKELRSSPAQSWAWFTAEWSAGCHLRAMIRTRSGHHHT
nr:hypothetical protein [Actinosynnema sp. ALI-1.44]